MPPRRSPSSKQLPTVPTHEVGTKPIQTTTNSVPKLQMPMSESAVPLTEANLNAAGGNTKASAVTVHDSEGPSTVASSKRQGPAHGSSASSYEDQRRQLLKKSATKSANPTSRGFSLRRLAIQLTALYAIIAYFFICPSDPSRAPAVCKSYADLQSYRDTAVSYARPYYQPYITQAQETLDPYYQPYAKLAAPVYTKAQRYVQPQIAQARNVYNRAVHPKLLNALTHSQKQAQPHFDRLSYEYERLVGPYTHRYTRLASEIYDLNVKPTYDAIARDTNKFVQPLYRQSSAYLSPVLAKAYPATRHHVQHTFLPFASSSFSTSRKVYGEQVHPRLASTFQLLIRFVREKLGPAIARFQSRYISPQLNKIQDKAFAYKAKSVASEKVASLDKELGKDVIDDEIEELLSEIKQTTTPAFTSVVPTGTEGTARVEPTALDNFAGTEEKEDVIAKKIQEEEAQLVQRAEKRKAIEALHDLYEVEIQKLGETEAALLADRLTQLRKAALRDIPNRFDVSVRNYRDECDKWVGRLDKYWDKANRDERTSTEDKISDGVLIARKAGSKLADQAEELEDEVDAYLRTHVVREVTSTEKAFKTVESFVGKAQDELGMGYAYLDDVTHADWQRYHVLQAMEGQWHHQLFGMRNGSVAHPQLDRSLAVEPVLANLKIELEKLSSEADARLVASRTRGEKRVKGQFLGVADAAERGYEAVRGAVSGGSDAVASAVTGASQVVFGEPEPTDLSGSISSMYTEATSTASSVLADSTDSVVSLASEASASVDSLYSAASGGATNVVSSISSFLLPTNVAKALDDATSSLQFGYGEASQSLVRLAGLQPSPTNAQQSATYFLAQATSYLADAQGSANAVLASYASEASKTAMSLAGQTATPTDLQGSAASAYSEATSAAALYADAAASEISLAANNAQGLFASVVASAYAALPTVSLPSSDDLPALSDVSATLSSQVHRATREAAKAVGISVTPESLQEHAESVYSQAASAASSVSASAASVLPTIPAGSLHEATRAAQRAVGISPSPESPAEYAESAYSQVVDAASAALSSASAALPTVQFDASALSSSLDQATRSAKSAIGLQGTPEGVAASASSLLQQASNSLHDATRTAIRAVGATPSPEGFVEHAESLASSVSEAVVSATESVRQRVEL